MALLGRTTLLLGAALVCVFPFACLHLWGRVRGPRAVRTLARLALIAGCQLSALLFAGLALNDYGTFYTSWSELVGAGANVATASSFHFGGHVGVGATPIASRAGGQVSSARSGPGSSTTNAAAPPVDEGNWTTLTWSSKPQWRDRGAVVSTVLDGGVTNLGEEAYVYLPPAYFTAGAAGRALPVVEVFSGYPGHQANLVSKLHYPDHLLEAIRAGRADPMILVMMRPSPTYPWDTECTDVPGGPQAFTYFAHDVPAAVASRFGLDPSAYGAIGDSTGGYCAAKLAMMDPARFTAAAAMSAYTTPATDLSTRGIFAHRADLKNHNDLAWRLENLPAPAVALLVCTSADETGPDGYAVAQRWLALVRSPMSADEIVLRHGGHNFKTWRREVPDALSWLSRNLAGPGARA